MADKKYIVRLKAHVGFPGVHIPGTQLMITKDPTIVMEAQRDAILEAIMRERVPVKKRDVEIKVSRSVTPPASSAPYSVVPARRKSVSPSKI